MDVLKYIVSMLSLSPLSVFLPSLQIVSPNICIISHF